MNTPFRPLNAPEKLRLTIQDFCVLDAAGAFASHAKSELIDGTIYVVNAQFSEHMKAKVRLLRRLADVCDAQAEGLEAWSEGSVRLGETSLPEPDIFVTRVTPQRGAVPGESVALVIEVADTTVEFDTTTKAALYAGAGVPEYWVVDLPGVSIYQLWSPGGGTYRERRKVPLGESIDAQTLPGVTVSTAGLV
jgi:Uma2 family endonuclease